MIFPPAAAEVDGADELAGDWSDEPHPLISVNDSRQNNASRRERFTIALR
jgi:hypothetical protein